MANTSRPASAASRAVISDPLLGAASTTKVPLARPAMMRLRRGKSICAGADDSDGTGNGFQSTAMGCRIDTKGKTTDNGQAGLTKRFSERGRIALSLCSGVATADNGKHGA